MLAFFHFIFIVNIFFYIFIGIFACTIWYLSYSDSSSGVHKHTEEWRSLFSKMNSYKHNEEELSVSKIAFFDSLFSGFVLKVIHFFFGLIPEFRQHDADYFFLEQVALRKKDKHFLDINQKNDIFKITFNKNIQNEYTAEVIFKDVGKDGRSLRKRHVFRRMRGKAIKKMLALARKGKMQIKSLEVKFEKPTNTSLLAYLNLSLNLDRYKFYRLKDVYSVYKLKILRYEKPIRYLARLQRLFLPENNLSSLFIDDVISKKKRNVGLPYSFRLIDNFHKLNQGFLRRKFFFSDYKSQYNRFVLWANLRQNILLPRRFVHLFSLFPTNIRYNVLLDTDKNLFVKRWLDDLSGGYFSLLSKKKNHLFDIVRHSQHRLNSIFPKYRESTISLWYPAFDAMKIKMSNLYLATFGKNRFALSLSELKNAKYSKYYPNFKYLKNLSIQLRDFDVTLNQFFLPKKGFRQYPNQSDYVLFPLNRIFTYGSRNYKGYPARIAGLDIGIWEPEKRLLGIYNMLKPFDISPLEQVKDKHLLSMTSLPSYKAYKFEQLVARLDSLGFDENQWDAQDDLDRYIYMADLGIYREPLFGSASFVSDEIADMYTGPNYWSKLDKRGQHIPLENIGAVGPAAVAYEAPEEHVPFPFDPLEGIELPGRMWGSVPLASYLNFHTLEKLGRVHKIKDNSRISQTGGIYDMFTLIQNENLLEELNKKKHSRRIMKVLKRRQKVIRKVAWLIYLHNIELKNERLVKARKHKKILNKSMTPVPRFIRFINYFNSFSSKLSLREVYNEYKKSALGINKVFDLFGFFYKNFMDLGLTTFEKRLMALVRRDSTFLKARKYYKMTEVINRYWNEKFIDNYFYLTRRPPPAKLWTKKRVLLPLDYDLMKSLQFVTNYMPGLALLVRSEDYGSQRARFIEVASENKIPSAPYKKGLFIHAWTTFMTEFNRSRVDNFKGFPGLENFFFKIRVYPNLLANSYFKYYEQYALKLGKYPWNFYLREFIYSKKKNRHIFMEQKFTLSDSIQKNFFSSCVNLKGPVRKIFRFLGFPLYSYYVNVKESDKLRFLLPKYHHPNLKRILQPLYGKDFSITSFEQQQQFDVTKINFVEDDIKVHNSRKYIFRLNLHSFDRHALKRSIKRDVHMNTYFLNPNAANDISYFHKVFWFTSKAFRIRAQVGGYYRKEFSRFIRLKNMEFLGTYNHMKYNLYIDKNVRDYTLQQMGFCDLVFGFFWNLYEEFVKAYIFFWGVFF